MLKYIFYPLQWIWRSFFVINGILTFFFFFPLFFILLRSEKRFPLVFKLKKVWGHAMMWIPLIFYKIEGIEHIQKKQHYVFCPNHTSFLDIILIYISIPVYFHTMGKAEVLKIPLFRRFFQRMNIPVNRKSRRDSHRAFTRAGNDLDKGISIALFPEGTIHHNYPHLGRFKNGPFRLAIERQVPIVPITFVNNWILLPDNYPKQVGHPGVARVIIHKPVPTTGMTENDLESLKKTVFAIIEGPMRENFPEFFQKKEPVSIF